MRQAVSATSRTERRESRLCPYSVDTPMPDRPSNGRAPKTLVTSLDPPDHSSGTPGFKRRLEGHFYLACCVFGKSLGEARCLVPSLSFRLRTRSVCEHVLKVLRAGRLLYRFAGGGDAPSGRRASVSGHSVSPREDDESFLSRIEVRISCAPMLAPLSPRQPAFIRSVASSSRYEPCFACAFKTSIGLGSFAMVHS